MKTKEVKKLHLSVYWVCVCVASIYMGHKAKEYRLEGKILIWALLFVFFLHNSNIN